MSLKGNGTTGIRSGVGNGLSVLCFCILISIASPLWGNPVTLAGKILDQDDRTPVEHAVFLTTVGELLTTSDSLGGFQFTANLPCTIYVKHINYETETLSLPDTISNTAGLVIEMKRRLIPVDSIDIYSTRVYQPIQHPREYTLNDDALRDDPQIANDIYRSVRKIPGITASDFSAKFVIRGDEYDKILVTLDNMQLRDPFHLKDLDGGGISFLDLYSISSLTVMPGGFSARYGQYMGGVLKLTTKDPSEMTSQVIAGISLTSASVSAQGSSDNKKAGWLVSFRRGYIDLALDLMGIDTSVSTTYYDLYAKGAYRLSKRQKVTGNLLFADDKVKYSDKSLNDVTTENRSVYFWVDLESTVSDRLKGNTVLSMMYQKDIRYGFLAYSSNEDMYYSVADGKRYTINNVASDWEYSLHSRVSILSGVSHAVHRAEYDYYFEQGIDVFEKLLDPKGTVSSMHLSARLGVLPEITVELGGRYDHVSFTGDNLLSPRFSGIWQFSEKNSFRIDMGTYYQSQGINQVDIADRDTAFYPAEKSRQYILSFLHKKNERNLFRVNWYWKTIIDRRPEYRVGTSQLYPFPEGQSDRIKLDIEHTEAKGIEFQVIKELSQKILFSGSYVFASVDDYLSGYSHNYGSSNEPLVIPGQYDQRHSWQSDFTFRISPAWSYIVSWQYRTGWPYTEMGLASGNSWPSNFELKDLYARRYPVYHRLDMQVRYDLPTDHGHYRFYVDVINVLNRDNIQSYIYTSRFESGEQILEIDSEYWFHFMPSLGITYTHYF